MLMQKLSNLCVGAAHLLQSSEGSWLPKLREALQLGRPANGCMMKKGASIPSRQTVGGRRGPFASPQH
eukprot:3828530-Pyramimonas_sp.AAC.1